MKIADFRFIAGLGQRNLVFDYMHCNSAIDNRIAAQQNPNLQSEILNDYIHCNSAIDNRIAAQQNANLQSEISNLK